MEDNQQKTLDEKIERNYIIFLLNYIEKTCQILSNNSARGSALIPKSIFCNSNEYIITSISKNAFKHSHQIKSINFSNDSKLLKIESHAFSYSSISFISIPSSLRQICDYAFYYCNSLKHIEIPEDSKLQQIGDYAFCGTLINSLLIPPNMTEFKEGWCHSTNNLSEITFVQNNHNIININNKLIIGKSKLEKEEFDLLIFSQGDIETISIPPFVKHIGPYAFEKCYKLKVIDIPIDSQLQTIGRYAINSQIESISIPSDFIEFKDEWCVESQNLININISPNNKRYFMYENKLILGKSSIELENFDVIIFCVRNIQNIKIPNFIKKIGQYAFANCYDLKSIIISNDSELQIIEKYAFYYSSIENILFPNHLKEIGENAFYWCDKLKRIEISVNSNLQKIGEFALCGCSFKSFSIPKHLKQFGDFVFSSYTLQILEINDDSEIEYIAIDLFHGCENTVFMISTQLSIRSKLQNLFL